MTFWTLSQCFTLDEGICLCRKGLRCPGRGGKGVAGVLLAICQCTRSVISARRPEEPSPAGPREEAEDFRAADSGVIKFLHTDSSPLTNQASTYDTFQMFLLRREISRVILLLCSLFSTQAVSEVSASQVQHYHNRLCSLLLRIELFLSLVRDIFCTKSWNGIFCEIYNPACESDQCFLKWPFKQMVAFTLIFLSSGFFCQILAMRFDASIHWPETLDLNGAAWLCPCLA